MLYVVSYDIAGDKAGNRRRLRVRNLLKDYGEGLQYSLFECHVAPDVVEDLCARAAAFLNPREDSLFVYPVCGRCTAGVRRFGAALPMDPDALII